MLSKEDNELITRVGPGTPMGSLMRHFWIPALTSPDLEPDGPPMRVRLLGENLIAFRTTSGEVGLVGDLCPHRCASLFFGRNEEDGLRCIYHGWKFDVTGACVDMPGEPEESATFKSRVFATAYPCRERQGVIWTYMGPRETPPPLPNLEANIGPERSRANRTMRDCNWLQALEGDIDTLHSEYLHSGATNQNILDWIEVRGGTSKYRNRLNGPLRFAVADTEFGTTYGAYRPAEENTNYWRIANFFFPFFTMTPGNSPGFEATSVRMWVPLDDEHVMFWGMSQGRTEQDRIPDDGFRTHSDRLPGNVDYQPDTTDWLGRFRPVQTLQNDFQIDREAQRTISFSGLRGSATIQDGAVTMSMGAILDRTKEHLAVSDTMIIRTRLRLLNAVRALEDGGVLPAAVDSPDIYRARSGVMVLPNHVNWLDGMRQEYKVTWLDGVKDARPTPA